MSWLFHTSTFTQLTGRAPVITTHPQYPHVYLIGAMGSRGLLYHSYLSQILVQQACHDVLTRTRASTSPNPDANTNPSVTSIGLSPSASPSPDCSSVSSPRSTSTSRSSPVSVQKDRSASLPIPSSTNKLLRPYWLSTRGYDSVAKTRASDSPTTEGEEWKPLTRINEYRRK